MKEVLMYDSVSLLSYCKSHGVCYHAKLRMIKKLIMQNPDKSVNDIINIAMQNSRNLYFYDGVPLRQYCKSLGINYDTIAKRINRLKSKNANLCIDDIIELSLTQEAWTKYYYGQETLYSYCQRNGFDINDVTRRFKRLRKRYPNLSLEDAINETVEYYENKKFLQNVTRIFNYLRENANFDNNTIEKIVDYLNIDLNCLIFLMNQYKFKVSEAISLIWFFHDNGTEVKMAISAGGLKNILRNIKTLKNIDEVDIKTLDFGLLFGIYKTGLLDTRYLILLREQDFVYYTIYKMKNELNLFLKRSTIEEVYDDVAVYLLELLDRLDNNIPPKIISYITKAVRGYIYDYLLKMKDDLRCFSLEEESSRGKSFNDKIHSNNKSNDNFADDTLDFLDTFDSMTKDFIIYRYQNNLSYEQIAAIFSLSLEELKKYECELLQRLRNDNSFREFFQLSSR